jgi:PIN domain nuclease of toxin-antitoxin system
LPETPAYVLDTSAIFCLLNDEAGADQVDALLAAARASPAQASIAIPVTEVVKCGRDISSRYDDIALFLCLGQTGRERL